jgi:signal transduction histidine kinase
MPYRSRIKIVLCLCWLLTGGPILFSQQRGGGKDGLIDSAMYFQEVKRDYPTALTFYRRALALDEAEHEPYCRILGDYAAILNVYFYLGDYPGAMEMVLQKLAVAEDHHDSLQMARSYNTIGFIYYRQGNISKSEVYYSLYLTLADAYANMADIGVARGHYGEALSSLFKAYQLYGQLEDTERVVHTAYKISKVYKDMQAYGKALEYAIMTLKDIGTTRYNEYDRASYYINAGNIYKDLAENDSAVRMTRQGLLVARSIRHREDIIDAWHTLADIYALQHRYDSAYFYYNLYSGLKDSVSNEKSRMEIEEIHEHYAADKKDKEIALQKEQLARQNLLKNILIFSSISLIAFILLLYNRRRLKQRANYEVKLNRQRSDLFGAIIMAQENERKRIAQDIHDTLGSMLSAAKLNLSGLDADKAPFTAEQALKYRASLKLLDEVSAEMRNIAFNLMPAGLSKIGLPAAVKGLLDTLATPSGMTINYSVYGFERRLTEELEISVYRILLELINNVIKHSRATLLTVQLIRYPDYINVVVEDDGIGFDERGAAGQVKGMGLGNILSRVKYLKGGLDIDSKEGAGTTVVIEIPC